MYRNNQNTYNYMQANYTTSSDFIQQGVFNKGLKNEKISFDSFISTILDIVATEKQYCENNCDINQDLIYENFNMFLKNTLKLYDKNIFDDINIVISHSTKLFDENVFEKSEDILFLSCLLYCIKDNYDQLTDENKQIYIMHFLKKIQFELENKSEYVSYFDYSSLLSDIKKYNISTHLIQFICLYLNINLVILDGTNENSDKKHKIYFIYDNIKPGKEFKMNIVLYKFKDLLSEEKNNIFYFVVSYCNIKLWKSETPLLKMIFESATCEHISTNKIDNINSILSGEKKIKKNKSVEKIDKKINQKNNDNINEEINDDIDNKNENENKKVNNDNEIDELKANHDKKNKKTSDKSNDKNTEKIYSSDDENTDDENADNESLDEKKENRISDDEIIETISESEIQKIEKKKSNKKIDVNKDKDKTKKTIDLKTQIKKYNKTSLNKMSLHEIIIIADKLNIPIYSGKTKKGENKTKKKAILIEDILNIQ